MENYVDGLLKLMLNVPIIRITYTIAQQKNDNNQFIAILKLNPKFDNFHRRDMS